MLIYSSNFWFFVSNRKLQLTDNSQIRQNRGKHHENSAVTHQVRIFMYKA